MARPSAEEYPWLSVDEVMLLLQVSQATVYRLAASEKWPAAEGRRSEKYSTEAVLKTLERRRAGEPLVAPEVAAERLRDRLLGTGG